MSVHPPVHQRQPQSARPALVRSPIVSWTATCALAAPVVAGFAIVVGAPLYTTELATAAGTSRLVVANGATLGVLLLLALGLLGQLVAGDRVLGPLGRACGLMALVGTVLAAGGAWDSAFALPYVASAAPGVLEVPTSGTLLVGFVVSYLVLAVGWAGFSVASWRAGLTGRTVSVVLLLGALLAIPPSPTAVRLLPLAIGCALAGRALLRAG